ncbi:MAG: hypothetical protein WBC87_17235, partial [Pseudolabrys sp.]
YSVWVAFVFGCVGKIDPVAASLGETKGHRSDFGANPLMTHQRHSELIFHRQRRLGICLICIKLTAAFSASF